ncbi:polyketide synthase [Saccharopolyspora indica]|uniref:polyketide synthase n=1 Tax=Saccharopolyspora indica TaxID=1229659 RepID=UPI0022EAC513|nr:polyketide synthase [Saccharopolyspora indica]MDA3644097.1 polyketide synthase [Saccharopolyspora indica]
MSDLVTVETDGRVAVVTVADSDGGNAISAALVEAVPAALAAAAADPAVHVIVAAGLPTVFAAGASREYLLTDERADVEPFVRAFPHCPLPVVAAMQGHAIGGGLSFGLYADVPVLSERSRYAANFLNYGLVPEYGTTWLLPSRLGHTLGTEMLLTGRGYPGAELRARSAPVKVVPHESVFDTALELARGMARAPRYALELLKGQFAERALAEGDAAIAIEAGRHEQAWGSADFRRLVEQRYGRAEEIAR